VAGIAAILAAPIAIASFLLGPAAFGWDFNLLFDPERAIRHPTASTDLIRMGWILDIPGYYLLLLPAAVVLHARSATAAPLATRLAWCGLLVYAITGTAGAAILAGTTSLFERFRVSDVTSQAALVEIHVALFGMVVDGLWNLLCMSGLESDRRPLVASRSARARTRAAGDRGLRGARRRGTCGRTAHAGRDWSVRVPAGLAGVQRGARGVAAAQSHYDVGAIEVIWHCLPWMTAFALMRTHITARCARQPCRSSQRVTTQ
jgi:hypothetical protein